WAAVGASLVTAAVVELLFEITPGQREALEGVTMLLATAVLFYVSYWLLSKIEVAKWNAFVKGRMEEALSTGSGFALASVAFLAVTSAMLYYMAFVFAGKGIADLQESGILGTSVVEWAPRIPVLGIYPTVQSLSLQFLLIVLLLVAVVWLHRNRLNGAEPDRR